MGQSDLVFGSSSRGKAIRQLVFLLTALAVAYRFSQLRFGLTGETAHASLLSLLSGKALIPDQYRVLVPWLVNLIMRISNLLPGSSNLSHVMVFQHIELLSVFLLLASFSYYASLFFREYVIAILATIILFSGLLFNYVLPQPDVLTLEYVSWFPSDMPSLLFITLGLILIYKQRWWAYYPLYVIATFNRETTCFLTFVYLFTHLGKGRNRELFFHCALQLSIWITIKYTLYHMYIGNPSDAGGSGLFHAGDFLNGTNLRTLTNVRNHPFIFSIVGYMWLPVLLMPRIVKNRFVSRSLLMSIPFCVGMFIVGTMTILRDYGELLPVIAIAFVHVIMELIRRDPDGQQIH